MVRQILAKVGEAVGASADAAKQNANLQNGGGEIGRVDVSTNMAFFSPTLLSTTFIMCANALSRRK